MYYGNIDLVIARIWSYSLIEDVKRFKGFISIPKKFEYYNNTRAILEIQREFIL